jgi:hypothetical protein
LAFCERDEGGELPKMKEIRTYSGRFQLILATANFKKALDGHLKLVIPDWERKGGSGMTAAVHFGRARRIMRMARVPSARGGAS